MPPFGLMFSVPVEINLGVITVWSGAIGNIPPGWFLCDGSNGTPDLRDRFVPSAGPTFSVNETGGSINHDHDFTSNGHNHNLESGTDIGTGAFRNSSTNTVVETATTNNGSIIPPFYALAYIQFKGI